MKNTAIGILIMLSITAILVVVLAKLAYTEVIIVNDKFRSELGKNYVVGKDTFRLIDYSIANDNFTMSNGMTVNSILIFNKKKQ